MLHIQRSNKAGKQWFVSRNAKLGKKIAKMPQWYAKQAGCEMHLLSLEATVRFWTQGGPEMAF